MTWTITGRSSGVLVGVTKYGNLIIRATGSHAPYFPSDPAGPAMRSDYTRIEQALRRLQTVQTDWRILSTDAVQNEIIDNAALLKSIKARSGKSIAEISCIDRMGDSEPVLSFNIALQPETFHQVTRALLQTDIEPQRD
jgi:hypothetical protein